MYSTLLTTAVFAVVAAAAALPDDAAAPPPPADPIRSLNGTIYYNYDLSPVELKPRENATEFTTYGTNIVTISVGALEPGWTVANCTLDGPGIKPGADTMCRCTSRAPAPPWADIPLDAQPAWAPGQREMECFVGFVAAPTLRRPKTHDLPPDEDQILLDGTAQAETDAEKKEAAKQPAVIVYATLANYDEDWKGPTGWHKTKAPVGHMELLNSICLRTWCSNSSLLYFPANVSAN
ncbi:MAG: hypothetical protein M1833_001729 [Piccolia ochrophora]|nr:MAG: hypothetical protein M1833_001729 [Piccolia ochrophora]